MKFSVITAVYNGKKFLPRLMASLHRQSYPHWEWIVQDGGSTDGTLDLLRAWDDPRVRPVSEPDTGVYDAWNKAVRRATGDWALFLGADDALLHPHTLAQCCRHLRRLPDAVELAFGALFQGKDGQPRTVCDRSLSAVYRQFFSNMGLAFPATFARLSLLRREPFDPRYRIAGDFDWAARVLTGHNLTRLPVAVSYMELGGMSSGRDRTLQDERRRVLRTRIAPKADAFMAASREYSLEEKIPLEPFAAH